MSDDSILDGIDPVGHMGEIRRMQETPGIGTCPTCGERATPEHSTVAEAGRAIAGCPNGHRWGIEIT